jgi:lipoprotein NlpD
MRHGTRMHKRFSYTTLVVLTALAAGCASQVTAPVRDSGGAAMPAVTTAPATQAAGVHIVRQGDTLLGIARQYGVTLPDLVAWNALMDPNQILVGQAIRVAPEGSDMGATATAIPIAPGVASTPVPQAGSVAGAPPLKEGPIGGRAPYSEQAAATPPMPDPAAPQVAPATGGQWQWPARGAVIAGYNEASNKGLDIGGRVGDPVFASAAGKVVYAGSGLRGYGKLIVIKHNQDYNSVYAHNDKLLVKEDDQVTQGQQIAELGSSESDRPKLHFEIRKQGKAVDPTGYLPAR